MADQYSKRPSVQRFERKPTFAGRDVKRTVVVRRTRPEKTGRAMRPMRSERG